MRIIITANSKESYETEDFDALVEYLTDIGFESVEVEVTDQERL